MVVKLLKSTFKPCIHFFLFSFFLAIFFRVEQFTPADRVEQFTPVDANPQKVGGTPKCQYEILKNWNQQHFLYI